MTRYGRKRRFNIGMYLEVEIFGMWLGVGYVDDDARMVLGWGMTKRECVGMDGLNINTTGLMTGCKTWFTGGCDLTDSFLRRGVECDSQVCQLKLFEVRFAVGSWSILPIQNGTPS